MTKYSIIFAGPSAVGKTYIADLLLKKYPREFEHAKLYTTRKRRSNEHVTDRIFVTDNEFKKLVESKSIIIHDEFGGNVYGYSKECFVASSQHKLLNTWPWLVPEFSKLKNVIVIGMGKLAGWTYENTRR